MPRSNDLEMTAGNYLARLPISARYRGDAVAGEIQILEPEQSSGRVIYPKSSRGLGFVYRDRYIQIVRDRVLFPSGLRGTYLRIFPNPPVEGPSGVAVLPLLNDKVLLRKMFRHATRGWEYEIPRGSRQRVDPSITATATRELVEELGMRAIDLEQMAEIYADTGLLASSTAIFVAVLEPGEETPSPDREEALGELRSFSYSELLRAIAQGEIRDGFTLSAVLLAAAKGLIPLEIF